MIFEVETITELPKQNDGVYTVKGDKMNIYVVSSACYTCLNKSSWEVIKKALVNPVTTRDLIILAEKFSTVEIFQLKKEGLI